MLKNLGKQLRNIRKQKSITLIELSKRTGVAQATLSRIETGTMTGTIESHEKIAEALGIGLAELYTGVDQRYEEISHLTQEQTPAVTHQSKNLQIELLTQESSKKKITPLLITLNPGSSSNVETQERGVEKFFWIIEGEIEAKVDQKDYTLKQGETIYFDASLPHQVKNTTSSTAKIFAAVSPSKI